MPTPKIRIGLPYSSEGRLFEEAQSLGAAVLLSAGSLHRPDRGGFQPIGATAWRLDCALDSGGFVAASQGGFRWDVDEYVAYVAMSPASLAGGEDRATDLGGLFPWAWWAAMDYCCEPEIASCRAVVAERIELTVQSYEQTLESLVYWRDEEGLTWVPDPMPTLQGRTASDYLGCAERLAALCPGGSLPRLVGLGSVCRRSLHGPEGLLRIVRELDAHLPPHVRLHLFGVKGSALAADLPTRVHSVDSMAWDYAAREAANQRRKVDPTFSNDTEHRASWMRRWYESQGACDPKPQLGLFG